MLKSIAMVSAAMLALTCPVFADEHRELGAHEHGHGTLNIAVEGTLVKMELEVPGDDIVGFEHDPSTPEEKTAMDKAKTTLASPLGLFKIPAAAKCTAKEAKVSIVEEKHEHEEEASKSEEKTEKEPEAHHNAFDVTYTLDCKSVADIKTIDFEYFKLFKNAQELDVNVVTPKGQSKFEATRDKPLITIGALL